MLTKQACEELGLRAGANVGFAIFEAKEERVGPEHFLRGVIEAGGVAQDAALGLAAAEEFFENCRVPSSQFLGVEGQGFINAMQVLDAGRIGIAALAVGLAQGAYDAARDYAFERKQFGQRIGRFQSIRAKLVENGGRIDAARLLTYRAASMREAGRPTTLEAAMAKLYSSEVAVRVAEDGVQIFGGYGFVKDYPAEKYFRDVKLTTIGEGTSEIQRLVIARQLLAA